MKSKRNPAMSPRHAEAGDNVGSTHRTKLVDRMLPPERNEPVEFPDFGARAAAVWGKTWEGAGSDQLIDETCGE